MNPTTLAKRLFSTVLLLGLLLAMTGAVAAQEPPDTTAPTVVSVTPVTADGTYKAGAQVIMKVNFSEPVYVTGYPYLSRPARIKVPNLSRCDLMGAWNKRS